MLLHKMRREASILSNKARFVEDVCKGDLIVNNRKRADLLCDLQERGYDLHPKDEDANAPHEEEDSDEEGEAMEDNATDAELAKGYEYLLGMKIWTLTREKMMELRRQRAEKTEEVETQEETAPETMWISDLDTIEELLDERDKELGIETCCIKKQKKVQSKKAKKLASKKTATKSKGKDAVSEQIICCYNMPRTLYYLR